jgi:amidohydrolase
MPKFTTYSLLFFLCCLCPAIALTAEIYDPETELEYLNRLYEQLHADPELSFYEASTSQRIVSELDIPGLVVTNNVGGHGVVAVLKNGEGPTLMLRADMDALPVKEKTGLEYASKVTFEDADNNVLPVMHACGHDMHMTVLTGAVRRLTAEKDAWQGTLLFVYQPAEERGAGARMMLDDGLFERFPRPDYNLTMHTSAELPAGKIGYTSGYTMANVDSVDILIRGVGGHGAYPHKTKDPVTIAAHLIVQLQTIVSRETSPLKATVITIGSIHGGSKHNIISDEVKLQLTVRSYSDETRKYLLKRIREVSEGVARTAGMPEELLPIVTIKEKYTPSVHNDPALTAQIVSILQNEIGKENILAVPPVMGGEDFSRYGRVDPPIPSALLWLGSVSPERFNLSLNNEIELPALHSPEFAPLPRPTIKTGVQAMIGIVHKLLAKEP